MAEYSFDIVADFDKQELVNALDQVRREIMNRFDFKDSKTEITLEDDQIVVVTEDSMKLQAVYSSILAKAVKRSLSPKVFDPQKEEQVGGGMLRQEIALRKTLSQEAAKSLMKTIKAEFKKLKVSIQGDALRVSDKDKDVLQQVIAYVKGLDDVEYPLSFTNYR